MKLGNQADYWYHPHILQHSDQVHQEEEGEEDQLDIFRVCQSHEDEIRQKCDIPFTHSVQMLHTAEKSSWNLSEIISKSFVFLYMTWHIYICLAFPRTDDNKVWTMYEEQNMNLIPNIEIDVNWHLNTTRGSILNNLYKPDTVLNVSHC